MVTDGYTYMQVRRRGRSQRKSVLKNLSVPFVLGARSSSSSNPFGTHANLHDAAVDIIGDLVVEDSEDDFAETNLDGSKASMEF
ncbi:hypothetical protein ACE6H2_023872 [Prunus campanulata]